MTLNITVATHRCIYRSADYRLFNWLTKTTDDFKTQKIVLVNTHTWSATVCFAGAGRTDKVDVGEWLAERVGAIQADDPFDRLLDELRKADAWLSTVAPPYNRHSFSIGAFDRDEAVFALVSNYEQPSGPESSTASARLSVHVKRGIKRTTFISGQNRAVTRPQRRWLSALAAQEPEPQRMHSALAAVNRDVAMRNGLVSPACFTTYLRLTGEGGGEAHDVGNRPFFPAFAIPNGFEPVIKKLLDERFGPGRAQLTGMSTVRVAASDEYHELQLREKPQNPDVHSNYGAYLKDRKGDVVGAEREYRRAIELNARHINALGNLANLLWDKGDKEQAERLYREALEVSAGPGNENVSWNYARFLLRERNDRNAARDVLDGGIANNPESGRLLVLRAETSLLNGNASEALDFFQRAREKGADQVAVESGYAIALHMSGAPVGKSIAAYRVAISLRPKDGPLRLNLAQLLFISGDDAEAGSQLRDAMTLGLDDAAQLEAQFYLLAHGSWEPAAIIQTMKPLLAKGTRLRWDVAANIDAAGRGDPKKAVLLKTVSRVLAGELHQGALDKIASSWPSGDQR